MTDKEERKKKQEHYSEISDARNQVENSRKRLETVRFVFVELFILMSLSR